MGTRPYKIISLLIGLPIYIYTFRFISTIANANISRNEWERNDHTELQSRWSLHARPFLDEILIFATETALNGTAPRKEMAIVQYVCIKGLMMKSLSTSDRYNVGAWVCKTNRIMAEQMNRVQAITSIIKSGTDYSSDWFSAKCIWFLIIQCFV